MVLKENLTLLLFALLISGCTEKYTPKPKGYFRISFPEKEYRALDNNQVPYKFQIPVYSEVKQVGGQEGGNYNINISIPQNKADIHITYKTINNDGGKQKLEYLLEDARTLAYKHTIKADAINEHIFINPGSNVYGTIYIIEGNVASPAQFFLTDSVQHFLRGSLYIRDVPNIDSLRPVIDFLKPDIIHLVETTSWN